MYMRDTHRLHSSSETTCGDVRGKAYGLLGVAPRHSYCSRSDVFATISVVVDCVCAPSERSSCLQVNGIVVGGIERRRAWHYKRAGGGGSGVGNKHAHPRTHEITKRNLKVWV